MKKVAPKRVRKPGSAKKAAGKKRKPKASLVSANEAQCFWTTDGVILSNLIELRDALERMTHEVYTYHVTKEKNDFADWIEAVLNDHELAKALRRSQKQKAASVTVTRRLRVYDI